MAQELLETCSDSSFEDVVSHVDPEVIDEVASVVVSDSEDTQGTRVPATSDIGLQTTNDDIKAEKDAEKESHTLKKDDTFFFSVVTMRVGIRLFRVPRDAFENQSEFFRNEFANCRKTATSGDIDGCLVLGDVEEDAFRDLLRLLYPPPRTSNFTGPILLTREQWIKVLDLAQRWDFDGIRSLAIQELGSAKFEEVEKLELALKYEVKQWYVDAYLALAKRPKPLTLEEGQRLGLDLTVKMAKVRERKFARKADALASAQRLESALVAAAGFAPFGGSYLPFGSDYPSFPPKNAGTSAASHVQVFKDSPTYSPLPNLVHVVPKADPPSPQFGRPDFGFPTTSETTVTAVRPPPLARRAKKLFKAKGKLNVDYDDDVQLKQDIKEIFGL